MQIRSDNMHRFDYSFLKNGMLPAKFVNLSSEISSLRTLADIRQNDFTDIYKGLESIAKVQSVKSSNAIEGILTSDDRIKAIVNQNSAPLNHDEEEIAGYRDALSRIHTDYQNLDFCEQDILSLHQILFTHVPNDSGGQYKTNDNVILEIDKDGNRRIRFTPVSADETKAAMEQLILAYMEARDETGINQLFLIPCVILDFLCIHPFKDGNGRMSRLLTLLLLYKNNYDVGKYISFEEQINNYKGLYYESLKQSSSNWGESKNTYFPFMENFLFTLYTCYKELDKRFAVSPTGKLNKTSRIEATLLNSLTPLSKAQISQILPDVSPTTIEKVLGDMVRLKKIEKNGTGRATKYRKISK